MRLFTAGLAAIILAAGAVGPASAPQASAQDHDAHRGAHDVYLETGEWTAWENRMPGGPRALHVTGEVVVRHAGYDCTLAPAAPQGFNPAILMLELTVEARPGMHAQAIQTQGVRFDLEDYAGGYTAISILHEGEVIADIERIPVTY
jgi:hypothetical protein